MKPQPMSKQAKYIAAQDPQAAWCKSSCLSNSKQSWVNIEKYLRNPNSTGR
jgi:hypothetical protein